jgi:poly(3-hydroxybutyrate) depolymerase
LLYSLFEAQHAALAPMRFMAELSRGWFGHPFSPFAHTPLAKEIMAGSDLFLRVTNRYEKPQWDIEATLIDGREVPIHIEVALDKPFCKLIRFKRDAPALASRKVLVVAPLSGHHSTLLRDTVRTMLPENDVYVTDWVDARMVPLEAGEFHLDDYVDYVREFIRLLSPELNVISVCQPTVPVLAAMSLMAADNEPNLPKTMIMMGGPIDARKSPTSVNNLATKRPYSWFEQTLIHRVPMKYPGFMRRVYPGFLQHLGFVAMNPDRHMSAHWDYYNHLVQNDGDSAESHRRFYDEYNAVLDMRCSTCRRSITSTPSGAFSRNSSCPRAACSCESSGCNQRRSRRRPCSPSRASTTTFQGTARPKPRMRSAPAFLRQTTSTSWCRMSATTASSPAGATARLSIRECANS